MYNFSCPFCGDSKKNLRKARGYVYSVSGAYLFTCHNCSLTTSVKKLVKHVNPVLYEEYMKEELLERHQSDKPFEFAEEEKKPVYDAIDQLESLKNINELPLSHPCRIYVDNRKLPKEWYDNLYYCKDYMHWVNEIIPEKFEEKALNYDEDRLVIPLYSKCKKLFGVSGRSLYNSEVKYLTIIFDETFPKVFGINTVDLKRRNYLFEGPFDAMFIPNSTASLGGELNHTINLLNRKTTVSVFDNEPRAKITCGKIQGTINRDNLVCIWPENLEYKDVNEMIVAGYEKEYIKNMIDKRTFSGLEAQLEFNKWKKI